jgi:hypothetical protein
MIFVLMRLTLLALKLIISACINSKKIVLAMLTVMAAVSLWMIRWWMKKQLIRVDRLKPTDRELHASEHVDFNGVRGRLTYFQRNIVAEARVKFNVPRYTEANLVVVRRYVVGLLKEQRPDIRGVDLEMHTDIIVPIVFLPSKRQAAIAELMQYRPWFFERWFWETPEELPAYRMDNYLRPPQ